MPAFEDPYLQARAAAGIVADDLWTRSAAECLTCFHTWTAVHPVAAGSLTCSQCGGHDTVRLPIREAV